VDVAEVSFGPSSGSQLGESKFDGVGAQIEDTAQ